MYIAGDMEAYVKEMYTDDVKILIPGYPMIKGKAGRDTCLTSIFVHFFF